VNVKTASCVSTSMGRSRGRAADSFALGRVNQRLDAGRGVAIVGVLHRHANDRALRVQAFKMTDQQ